MSKTNVIYKCMVCGKEYVRMPFGKCSNCGTFDQFEELSGNLKSNDVTDKLQAGVKTSKAIKPSTKASTIKELDSKPIKRIQTGITELDRVLGGGFVDGEVVLLAASPGAGKSTLSLNIANKFAEMENNVLYVSGEESEQQIGLRAKRMNIDNDYIKIISETNIEIILGHLDEIKPKFLVVDSLQTMASSNLNGSLGSIQQSKEAATVFTLYAKQNGIITILISQVTKD